MPIKSAFMPVGVSEDTPQVRKLAFALAKRDGATLQVCYPLADAQLPKAFLAEVPSDLIENMVTAQRARAAQAKTAFIAEAEAAGIVARWHTIEAQAGSVQDALIHYARLAEIVVMGQAAAGSDAMHASIETMILQSGRPVLMVPNAGNHVQTGTKALMCWNATRESTRAAYDSLALLLPGAPVVLYSSSANAAAAEQRAAEMRQLADTLALHGHVCTVESHVHKSRDPSIGDEILNAAADYGCDLIVMGGYGHSRMRELILGGATLKVLANMTIPVCLSH